MPSLHMASSSAAAALCMHAFLGSAAAGVPVPNPRQLDFMGLELTQFMHFGIPTFWDPPPSYLYGDNPTYHDCHTTSIDYGPQTKGYYPCLNPDVFNPTDLDAENWMAASASMGMREIIITAHHEGGFALWPSKHTPYSVAKSKWKNGKGDVLREFADAANKWGIKIGYYLNVQDDGYMNSVANYTCDEFITRQVGMVTEVLTDYGPVNRFWFDGTSANPCKPPKGSTLPNRVDEIWDKVYKTIRTVSPATMITAYRGDVCAAADGKTLYTNDGPPPNSTITKNCLAAHADGKGKYFHPSEEHGITMQEGPDGNTDAMPTYWFWHPTRGDPGAAHATTPCAHNITGCPWVGHANASRIFDSYLVTVGRGAVLNMNIPPERTGKMNVSVVQVMADAGKAINDTFHKNVAIVSAKSGPCKEGVVTLKVPAGAEFDYVVSAEDMRMGARFANYSIEYQEAGSSTWKILVPPCGPAGCNATAAAQLGDRPDGHDPRDSHIGTKRIDLPVVQTAGAGALKVSAVRLNCIAAFEEPVHVRSFSLHKKTVPWE